ncbi:MAG: hypothetical protein JW918_09205 [Anaerolineae bacterium]|nr:hypothetical protein [Anaerolineae bacterium]
MKKSTVWQSAVSAIVIVLAVLITLNIPHPDWITGLLFWQPAGQREIAWHLGADLGDTHRITLVPDVSEGQVPPNTAQMQAALNVVQSRARSLSAGGSAVQLQGNAIVAQVPSMEDPTVVTQALQTPGLVEFIVAGGQYLTPGEIVETKSNTSPETEPLPSATPTPTATLTPTAEITTTTTTTPTPEATPTPTAGITATATATVTATEPATTTTTTTTTPTPETTPTPTAGITATATVTATEPATTTTPEATPTQEVITTETLETAYATILDNNDLEYIELGPPDYGYYTIRFNLKPEAQTILVGHGVINPDVYICITLDKRVLTCALPNQLLGIDQSGASNPGPVKIPIWTEGGLERTVAALLHSGALPVQLRVEKVERAGSTLGEQVAKQIGTASIIALSAALVFLLVQHRLLGLLADLALLAFGLLSLALCKIIPVPITLANVVGLAAASLSTLGGLLSIAERLRRQARAGFSLPKAVEASFSGAWPSIRNTHFVLLLFAITAWVIGAIVDAQTIYWLGVSLVASALAGLFVTMVFCRSLIRLILSSEAVQTWLNERRWLLDI